MIRVKCPKCAFSLALDDDEAGQVGECTECGARFRVPTPKAAAPSRPRPAEDKKRPPPRPRDYDDDEDEDEDEEELDDQKPKKPAAKPRAKEAREQTKALIQTAVSLVLCTIVVGVAGIFISRLGMAAAILGVLAFAGCSGMLARNANADSGMAAFLIMLGPIVYIAFLANDVLQFMPELQMILVVLLVGGPIYGIVWSVQNWDRAAKLCVVNVACVLLFCAGELSWAVNVMRLESRREALRQTLGIQRVVVK
ncbi:MAG TPA: hypothetical protein VE988_10640 [Gemmataceae bacterium]|nr:hypothetical protein [Gemmataceae bacterium]